MYATTVQNIKVPCLHNAAYVLSLRENSKGDKIYKFRSLYMDKSGECAISYYGRLSEQEIKEVMINFCYPGEDKSYDEIHPSYNKDYYYPYTDGTDEDYTIIYTPKGLDYRTLQ